jgi:hypothetical protein
MSKPLYSTVQIPAIPFPTTAMELFKMLEQVIFASESSFRDVPICARNKLM